MRLRFSIRHRRSGGEMHDRVVQAVASAENADDAGRDAAYAVIRKIHSQHPMAGRACVVPNCCPRIGPHGGEAS